MILLSQADIFSFTKSHLPELLTKGIEISVSQ